jgi:putative NADH-flavin reductase
MKLTVFGATGATGRQVLTQALAAGHQVTAVARRPEALEELPLRTVRAELADPLDEAVAGADAVLSALGGPAGRAPTTVYSAGVTAITAAMGRAGVRRIVAVSAVPVAPPTTTMERRVVYPLLHRFFGGCYRDMAVMEELLAAGDRDWTVFRPPRLTDKPGTGRYRTAVDEVLPGAATLPRADLAAAMLAAVQDDALTGHIVTIAR